MRRSSLVLGVSVLLLRTLSQDSAVVAEVAGSHNRAAQVSLHDHDTLALGASLRWRGSGQTLVLTMKLALVPI